ncbi:MAG: DNA-binding protein [Bacteroidota bacterium]|nr:DNA-binding protein [Bacteroidota bacterium]
MIVVSDTSAISNLFIIGELDLLRKVYEEIFLPKAVIDELLALENFGLNIDSIKHAVWIKSVEVTERVSVVRLLSDLDLGEAKAIVLANEMHADWLLIDETKGRKIAKDAGLQTIGLL